jgi:hypothetical protein
LQSSICPDCLNPPSLVGVDSGLRTFGFWKRQFIERADHLLFPPPTDRETHKAVTYRLLIERIGDQEFADASYAPRRIKADEFPTVDVIALIRHDGNDLLFRPLNDEWRDDQHLESSGLHVVEAGDELYLILGKSSDLRAVLAAHPHDNELPAWHFSMRLEVSSSNFPLFDRNPKTNKTIATKTIFVAQTNSCEMVFDSHRISLPIVTTP